MILFLNDYICSNTTLLNLKVHEELLKRLITEVWNDQVRSVPSKMDDIINIAKCLALKTACW